MNNSEYFEDFIDTVRCNTLAGKPLPGNMSNMENKEELNQLLSNLSFAYDW